MRSTTTGVPMLLMSDMSPSEMGQKMTSLFNETPYARVVCKIFAHTLFAHVVPYCRVTASDVRAAVCKNFMTDAILDVNLLWLRRSCAERNPQYYPLLYKQASSFNWLHGLRRRVKTANENITRVARSAAECAATPYGLVINVKQRHWIGAVVNLVDHIIAAFDTLPSRTPAPLLRTFISRL